MSDEASGRRPLAGRIFDAIKNEVGQIRPRLYTLDLASRAIPPPLGNELRAGMLRRMGFTLGEGTAVLGTPHITGGNVELSGLTIGRDCVIGVGCAFDLAAEIVIGDGVNIGHQTMILTSSHELGPREHRAGAIFKSPVTIETGAWLGPRCIVLPGVTIGKGAVVSPGSLVNKNVGEHTRVGGTPIKLVDSLEP